MDNGIMFIECHYIPTILCYYMVYNDKIKDIYIKLNYDIACTV